ncbi:DUF899 domain-containing protein [Vulgatibacter incomptus]|uniref:Thioredoxin domain-containing protein n=1 Tax=Vulgatibacter incomptus TaxID=1391653 RepID=A0A0K1PFZ7_9BACT|nr:thioredoxin family protein [Vulgatibacter incomptus]AKU92458.1 hypothetical protein AKJ08_2845 [Vulgatibacter incomptus]
MTKIGSKHDWLEARKALLAKEKELTRLGDELSTLRRALPWVRVDQSYEFDTPAGRRTLAQLFEGRSQLVVYHFMFAPEWEAGCKSCSFWADNFNGIAPHLEQRDVSFVAVSRAPLEKLQSFGRRMGWTFPWVSSHPSSFNFDFGVSFTPEAIDRGTGMYNFRRYENQMSDLPGISVFAKNEAGDVFHTYSCYSRGVELLNSAYRVLDLVPKGRDEGALPYPTAWLRLRDQYGT